MSNRSQVRGQVADSRGYMASDRGHNAEVRYQRLEVTCHAPEVIKQRSGLRDFRLYGM